MGKIKDVAKQQYRAKYIEFEVEAGTQAGLERYATKEAPGAGQARWEQTKRKMDILEGIAVVGKLSTIECDKLKKACKNIISRKIRAVQKKSSPESLSV